MRRRTVLLGVGIMLSMGVLELPVPGPPPAAASGPEGCILFSPALPEQPTPTVGGSACKYTSTHTGGYACSAEECNIVIKRGKKKISIKATAGGADPDQTTIRPKDKVSAKVKNGNLVVGSPDPQ